MIYHYNTYLFSWRNHSPSCSFEHTAAFVACRKGGFHIAAEGSGSWSGIEGQDSASGWCFESRGNFCHRYTAPTKLQKSKLTIVRLMFYNLQINGGWIKPYFFFALYFAFQVNPRQFILWTQSYRYPLRWYITKGLDAQLKITMQYLLSRI